MKDKDGLKNLIKGLYQTENPDKAKRLTDDVINNIISSNNSDYKKIVKGFYDNEDPEKGKRLNDSVYSNIAKSYNLDNTEYKTLELVPKYNDVTDVIGNESTPDIIKNNKSVQPEMKEEPLKMKPEYTDRDVEMQPLTMKEPDLQAPQAGLQEMKPDSINSVQSEESSPVIPVSPQPTVEDQLNKKPHARIPEQKEDDGNFFTNTGKNVVSGVKNMGFEISKAFEDQSLKIAKGMKSLSNNKSWQRYNDGQIKDIKRRLGKIETFGSSIPEQKGSTAAKVIGGMIPMISMAAATIVSRSPAVASATTGMFSEMMYGSGIDSYDKYKKQTGEKVDEATRTGVGVLYSVLGTVPFVGVAEKTFGGVGTQAVKTALDSNKKFVASSGKEIFEYFQKESPKLAKKLLKGGAKSVGSMEIMEVGQKAVDKWMTGQHVSLKDFGKTALHAAGTGLTFAAVLDPFAIHMQSRATAKRRERDKYVTLGKTKFGDAVEIVQTKEGNKGLTPEGKVVEVDQDVIKNSFTMTTKDFNEAVKSYKENGKAQDNIEQKAQRGRAEEAVKNLIDPETGNIKVASTSRGETFFVNPQKTTDGKVTGINAAGEAVYINPDWKITTKTPQDIIDYLTRDKGTAPEGNELGQGRLDENNPDVDNIERPTDKPIDPNGPISGNSEPAADSPKVPTINPIDTKAAELRQEAEGYANKSTGKITVANFITEGTKDNVPIFVVAGSKDDPDNSVMIRRQDGKPFDNGEQLKTISPDVLTDLEETDIDDYVKAGIEDFKQTKADEDVSKKNSMVVDGKTYYRIDLPEAKEEKGFELWDDGTGDPEGIVKIPDEKVKAWETFKKYNPESEAEIVSVKYGDQDIFCNKNKNGTLTVVDPMTEEQINGTVDKEGKAAGGLKQTVEEATKGKFTAILYPVVLPKDIEAEGDLYQAIIAPNVKKIEKEPEINQNDTPAPSQDNNKSEKEEEPKIITQNFGKTPIGIVEHEGYDEVVPSTKLPFDKILPILQKKFKNNKKFKLDIKSEEAPGETKYDDPIKVVTGIKIVPIKKVSKDIAEVQGNKVENSKNIPEVKADISDNKAKDNDNQSEIIFDNKEESAKNKVSNEKSKKEISDVKGEHTPLQNKDVAHKGEGEGNSEGLEEDVTDKNIQFLNDLESKGVRDRLNDKNEPEDQKEYWKEDLEDLKNNPKKYWDTFSTDAEENKNDPRIKQIKAIQEYYKNKGAKQPATKPQTVVSPPGVSGTKKEFAKEMKEATKDVNLNPTEGQKEAGNYKKAHIKLQGLDITIENPKGSVRKGTDEKGNKWETKMNNHYGEFVGTKGYDGDPIDVFVGDNPNSNEIFVVDQKNPETGEVESRNVESRYTLSKEERKNKMLSETQDIAEDQKIYIQDKINEAYSIHDKVSETERVKAAIDELQKTSQTKTEVKILDGEGAAELFKDDFKKDALDRVREGNWIGLTYKGKIVINPKVSSKKQAIQTWVHEKAHAQLRNEYPNFHEKSEYFTELFERISPEEIKRVLGNAYDDVENDVKAEEYLCYLSEEYALTGKILGDVQPEIKYHIEDIVNAFTTTKKIKDAIINTRIGTIESSRRVENSNTGREGSNIQGDIGERADETGRSEVIPESDKRQLTLSDNLVMAKKIMQGKHKVSNGNSIRFKKEDTPLTFGEKLARAKEIIEKGKRDRLAEEVENVNKEIEVTPKEKETHYNYTLIKRKLSAFKKGYRAGDVDTKKRLLLVKREIIKYAKQNIPLEKARSRELGTLLTMVGKADEKNIEDVFNKIDNITLGIGKVQNIKEIEKILNNVKVKKVNGRLEGKLNPDTYKVISTIKHIVSLKKEDEVSNYVDNVLNNETADDTEAIALFTTFSMLRHKTPAEVANALAKLREIVTTGRMWYNDKIQARKKHNSNIIATIVNKIIGDKPLLSQIDRISSGKKINDGTLKKYLLANQSFEWILDIMSNDKSEETGQGFMQNYFGDIVTKATNDETKGIDDTIKLVSENGQRIFGLSKNKLQKEFQKESKIEKHTGVFYTNKLGEKAEMRLSPDMGLKLWMDYQDKRYLDSFETMGLDDKSIQQLETFLNNYNPKLLEFGKWQLDTFYQDYHKGINDKFKEYYFANLPNNKNYSPKKVEYAKATDEDELLAGKNVLAGVGNGSLKSVVHHKNALTITSANNILLQHINNMEHFKAWVGPMKELRGTLGSKEVQNVVKLKCGESVKKELNFHLNKLAGGGEDRSAVLTNLDFMRRNFVTAELGLNPGPFPKQLVSVITYMSEMPVFDYAAGIMEFAMHPISAIKTVWDIPMVQTRYKKGFTQEMKTALKSKPGAVLSGSKSKIGTIRDYSMILTKLGDFGGVAGAYTVFRYNYNRAKARHKTDEVAYKFALMKTDRAISRSQQSGANKDTSRIQANQIGKFFTMFRNSQQQYGRWEYAGWRNLMKGRGKIRNNIKIIALFHLVLPVVFQLVTNAITDPDDETKKKRLMRAGVLGSANGLLIAGDIVEFLLNNFIGDNFQYQATPIESSIVKAGYGSYNIGKAVSGHPILEIVQSLLGMAAGAKDFDKKKFYSGIEHLGYGVNNLMLGLPYRPTKKIVKKVDELAHPERTKQEKATETGKTLIKGSSAFVSALNEAYAQDDKKRQDELNSLKDSVVAKNIHNNYGTSIARYESRIKKLEKAKKVVTISKKDLKDCNEGIIKLQALVDSLYARLAEKYKDVEFQKKY